MNTKNSGKQAIIWGRYSSDKQAEGDSRDRQERLNRAFAERQGIKVLAEYFDEATSVKDKPTPLFMKVLAELPSQVGIICENLDRINRGHPWRAKAFIADILDAGHFIATSQDSREYTAESIEQLDTMVIGDMSTNVARYENNKRTKRVNEEIQKALDLARQGKPAPLGAWLPAHLKYNFETHTYDINQENKATIKRIFNEYKSGKGTKTICKGLNNDNTRTFGSKKEGAWTASTISKILRNERAIGTLTIKGERMPNAFQPAITESLFFQVQSMLAKNINRRGKRDAEKVQNVFRNLCFCSVCGAAVKVYAGKYLGCSGYRRGTRDKNGKPCTVKNLVPFAEMEQEFLEWFVPQAKDALLGKDDTLPVIDALQAKLTALQGKIDKALDWLVDDKSPMPEEQIKSRISKMEVEKRQVEASIAEAKAKSSSKAVLPNTLHQLNTLIHDSTVLGNQETRRKIAALVPSIVQSVVVDIKSKLFPSFTCCLVDGQTIEWHYQPELGYDIIGADKDGKCVLGKPILMGGYYERK